METTAQVIGPKGFPEAKNVYPFEFALVPDKQHAEEKEEVGRVSRLEMEIKFRIHELDEIIESQ